MFGAAHKRDISKHFNQSSKWVGFSMSTTYASTNPQPLNTILVLLLKVVIIILTLYKRITCTNTTGQTTLKFFTRMFVDYPIRSINV